MSQRAIGGTSRRGYSGLKDLWIRLRMAEVETVRTRPAASSQLGTTADHSIRHMSRSRSPILKI
jgi:hypothetical protein